MDFPLQFLESSLPELWLLAGESLLEAELVGIPTELEKHLWVVPVADFEVEIQISPSRVQAYTCDCQDFQRNKGCGHVAAGLLRLRSHLSSRQEKKKKAARKAQPTTRLTTPTILSNVSREDLVNFVRDYARSNRNFNIALKARFAGSVPMADQGAKYQQLLGSTIKAARNKNDQFSFRGSQKIFKVLRELLQQTEQLMLEFHYSEAIAIVLACLEKVGPILRKAPELRYKLEDTLLQIFQQLEGIARADLAPDLLDSIWLFLVKEIGNSTIQDTELLPAYFKRLLLLADSAPRRERLLQVANEQLPKTSRSAIRQQWLIFKLQILQQQEANDHIQAYIVDHLHEPGFLLFSVEEAFREGYYKKAVFLARQGLVHIQDDEIVLKLRKTLLKSGQHLKDKQLICEQAELLFIHTQHQEYLELLKEHCQDDWKKKTTELLDALQRQPYSRRKRDAIAQVMTDTERFSELLDYISRLQSIELLMKYDTALWKAEPAAVAALYQQLIDSYLQQHLGRKPSQKIREIISHLFQSKQNQLADQLLLSIRERFTERHSLLEELAVFPK
jgi:hypothetical protein